MTNQIKQCTETITVAVKVTLDNEIIDNLIYNALDHAITDWCSEWQGPRTLKGFKTANATCIEVVDGGENKAHTITYDDLISGLKLLAIKEPKHFARVISLQDDANTADLFIQYVIFKAEIYS